MHSFTLLLLFMLSLVVRSFSLRPRTVVHDATFTPNIILNITDEVKEQSCLASKSIVVVNGTSPGPEIRITAGRTYWIRVYNSMPDKNLTMHWHGVSMAMSPFADGTPGVSQWPIPPANFFDYEINVPVTMAGTYFYHSHVGFQAVSCAGPLIVDSPPSSPPLYRYDEERTVFIQDAFVRNDTDIEAGLKKSPLFWSGDTTTILVNGKGGGIANGTVCNATLSTIDVRPGKTYRLRFISATALTLATLAIEGHETLTVIEADGSYTMPYNTSYLQIGSGQRFSVLLTTKSQPEKQQYYMQLESRERTTLTRSYAVLNYAPRQNIPLTLFPPTDATKPLVLPNITRGFLDYKLKPYTSRVSYSGREGTMPLAKDVTRTVTITIHQSVNGPTIWIQNGLPWTETYPREPYLVSLYKNNVLEFPSIERALANNGLDPVTRTFPASIGEVLEIIIQNTGADKGGLEVHPFHFHGAHFWDLGSGNGTYNQSANEALMLELGAKPVLRDSTMLYRYATTAGNGTAMGWRAWRVKATQPGAWMLHCHILQHMIMGMQSIWVMGNASQVLAVDPLSVQGYLEFGGSVVGNETFAPSVVHFKDPK